MANEREILRAFLDAGAHVVPRGLTGPGDDVALVRMDVDAEEFLALTTDAIEEGVHFREGWLSWEDLAFKAVSVTVSDLAAASAEPVALLLSLAWPRRHDAAAAARLGAAMREACAAFGCPLIGGDTDVREGPLRLEATALGRTRSPLARSGARAGDAIFVSGPLGGAALAVEALEAGSAEVARAARDPHFADALRCFRRPVARLDVARAVRGRCHAAIDLSDGLLPDLRALASASGLAARLVVGDVPRHPAVPEARTDDLVLSGGEDYELLLAGPASLEGAHPALRRIGALAEGTPGEVTLA